MAAESDRKEVIVSQKQDALAPFGSREDIREIAHRVQIMAPGGRKLSEPEALALAQGAVMHGLDPFIGEIWYIPGSGLMAGIQGRRKAARHQMGRGGNFRTEFDPITNPDERALYQIGEGDLAFKCLLFDSETTSAYVEAYANLKKQGLPEDLIPTLIGKKPYTLGIGILKRGAATKMEPVQCAMKRSEADALKRRFYLPFGAQGSDDQEAIEGEWIIQQTEEAREANAKKTPEQKKRDRQALWGQDAGEIAHSEPPKNLSPWPAPVLQKVVDAGLAAGPDEAILVIQGSPFSSLTAEEIANEQVVEELLSWIRQYRRGIEMGQVPQDAAAFATAHFRDVTKKEEAK